MGRVIPLSPPQRYTPPMPTRRTFLKLTLATSLAQSFGLMHAAAADKKIPVIFDTDIGDDIDDTWALLMLLRMPQFDVKLAVGDNGNGLYRARLLARFLELTGNSQVPVGIGPEPVDHEGNQAEWLGDYRIEDYPGLVHEDGIQAIIDTIHASEEPVTLLCVGPVPNIAEALRRDPTIARNARFVGMYGSIRLGYGGAPEPSPEWNVRANPAALQAVFDAPWEIVITPLDTCGLLVLEGENYRRIHDSDDPWLQALMENYRAWLPKVDYMDPETDTSKVSSTLFDTVAVYLAWDDSPFVMEDLPLRVSDDGHTVIDPKNGRTVRCAMEWRDLEAFEARLTDILLGQ